jgi:hypothetical protein
MAEPALTPNAVEPPDGHDRSCPLDLVERPRFADHPRRAARTLRAGACGCRSGPDAPLIIADHRRGVSPAVTCRSRAVTCGFLRWR